MNVCPIGIPWSAPTVAVARNPSSTLSLEVNAVIVSLLVMESPTSKFVAEVNVKFTPDE